MNSDNLLTLKDDMIAYIAGHGLRRIPAFVSEEIPSVLWEDENNPDGWKEFVETAKAAGAAFLSMSEVVLKADDVDMLMDQMHEFDLPDQETADMDFDQVQALKTHAGKIGFLQLGFAHQGVMFVHETTTEWYEQYQWLLDSLDDLSDIVFDHGDDDSLL
jgi:hypothetical protein